MPFLLKKVCKYAVMCIYFCKFVEILTSKSILCRMKSPLYHYQTPRIQELSLFVERGFVGSLEQPMQGENQLDW